MSKSPVEEKLRNLSAVTDSTLARLDVEDLLVELLERVRTILDADTAAVLLRCEGSNELEARAACGLEEEVRQGFRLPFGVGFAGSIAATRAPVLLNRVDETTVANPILYEKGIRVMLGVPLWSDDDVIGVLHVGRLENRPFGNDDIELLQVTAERVASATQARRLAVEAAASRLLERGLLPTWLPQIPGLQFAARYIPGEGRSVGGDWYDTFLLPNGDLWCVAGDVAGHGLNAAVVMGRIRSALRAYALSTESIVQALELTDRKVQHFEIDKMATVVCATARPPYDVFEVCTVGHPPPALAVPGKPTEFLQLPVGPPLGTMPDVKRISVEVHFPPGASMLLYTDGLIERRYESIEDGFARLRAAVNPMPAEDLCRSVLHRMIGNTVVGDDVAVLAVHSTT